MGLDGHMEAVELLDDDGGFGDGSFPKPGSSFGSIFGEYWGTVQLGKRSREIPFISSSRLAVRVILVVALCLCWNREQRKDSVEWWSLVKM